MKKNVKSEKVGDAKSPPLQATKAALTLGADQATNIQANMSSQINRTSTLENLALTLKTALAQKGVPASCKQFLWLSFFFDGTGNNLNADIGLLKHSNIARLYRAHRPTNTAQGTLSVYIPGVGTYFPEIGDDGGSSLGMGCGSMGDERLTFALKQFDIFLKSPLARANASANAIEEINIAVFGFSRGAALARVFVNMIMELRCDLRGGRWKLRIGGWPVRFRFMGLFDTVASVGLPMSSNTTGVREAIDGDTVGMIEKRLSKYKETRPEGLAFFANAIAGADPAPGSDNGHDGWGSRLHIHETVEQVKHFVAAHEIRNSFPLDSASILLNGRISKPGNFYEAVYPGAHSDVGGGYTPGEGGKSIRPSESLSLIALHHMFNFALQCGVPMLAELTIDNQSDFELDSVLRETYNHYLKSIGSFNSVGNGFNRHMALYYAWRFRAIRQKAAGNRTEARRIQDQDRKFRQRDAALTKEVDGLAAKETLANISLNALMQAQETQRSDSEGDVAQKASSITDADVETARQKSASAHDARMKANARQDAVPDMTNFQAMLSLYDRQLLVDVLAIRAALDGTSGSKRQGDLRPHYKVLLEAYENEFEKNNGLKDEKVISFFDDYVHDSLAGFAKDATLPSDPRVVYLGGDEKYRYASLEDDTSITSGGKRMA